MQELDFSARGWGRVILFTALWTAVTIGIAIFADSPNVFRPQGIDWTRLLLVGVALPSAVSIPVLLFLTTRLRQLAVAHHELAIYASTDSLTRVLNRGAFITLVDAYLDEVREHERAVQGALLVVDADNFKAINDSLGHDRGDEALRLIAGTIKANLRSPDLVGRIGGEEFGVFLPGTSPERAAVVAERIRRTVTEIPFGRSPPLSVSIGGITFASRARFEDLFKAADRQLYAAKQAGRNRTSLKPLSDDGAPAPA